MIERFAEYGHKDERWQGVKMYRLLAPASGEGERKMNQPAGESGRKEAHDVRQDEHCPGSRVTSILLQRTRPEIQQMITEGEQES